MRTKASNFLFLKQHDMQLMRLGALAERYFLSAIDIAKSERDDGEYARCTDVPLLPKGHNTIFDRFDTESGTKATRVWARQELKRLRHECEVNCGVGAHAFIHELMPDWSEHPAFIERHVEEFVNAVKGSKLTEVKHHVAKNFGIIYAGACLAIKKRILPWKRDVLLECICSCFLDAMGRIATPDDNLLAGKNNLFNALRDSSKWPSASKCSYESRRQIVPLKRFTLSSEKAGQKCTSPL
jgi:hypothetical protein